MMRVVDVLYSLPYIIIVIVLLALLPAKTPNWSIGTVVPRARRRIVADDGPHRARAGYVSEEPGVHSGRARHRRVQPKIIFRHLIPNTLAR